LLEQQSALYRVGGQAGGIMHVEFRHQFTGTLGRKGIVTAPVIGTTTPEFG
jgi:hypothetical protein